MPPTDYQYEWGTLIFGRATDYVTEELEGLLSMATVAKDERRRIGGHGAHPSLLSLGPRVIEADMTVVGVPGTDIESKLAVVRSNFKLPRLYAPITYSPFKFKRPGEVIKRVYARCTERDIPSNWKAARGLAKCSFQLTADDPVIYSDALTSTAITLVSGATAGQAVLTNLGDHADGMMPIISIVGPATDPIVTNTTDGKAIRFVVALTAAQTLVVNLATMDVKINGVENFGVVANDAQWWSILPGANTISFNRSAGNTGAAASATIEWRHSWQ